MKTDRWLIFKIPSHVGSENKGTQLRLDENVIPQKVDAMFVLIRAVVVVVAITPLQTRWYAM